MLPKTHAAAPEFRQRFVEASGCVCVFLTAYATDSRYSLFELDSVHVLAILHSNTEIFTTDSEQQHLLVYAGHVFLTFSQSQATSCEMNGLNHSVGTC